MRILYTIVVGFAAGFLASKIMKTKGGFIRNVLVGILGSGFGTFIFSRLGIYADSNLGGFVFSVLGACILLWLINRIFR